MRWKILHKNYVIHSHQCSELNLISFMILWLIFSFWRKCDTILNNSSKNQNDNSQISDDNRWSSCDGVDGDQEYLQKQQKISRFTNVHDEMGLMLNGTTVQWKPRVKLYYILHSIIHRYRPLINMNFFSNITQMIPTSYFYYDQLNLMKAIR